jgi:hypothetical protein
MRFPRALLVVSILLVAGSAATAAEPATQDDVDRSRGAFARFLDAHPEIADEVASEPGYLKDDGYVKERPELEAFFEAHPLVKADPRAFVTSRRRLSYEPDLFDKTVPFLVFACIFAGLLWAMRSYLENRRFSKAAAVQSEIHTKLLDRFGSSQEMLAYMQTEAGKRFLESGTLAVEERPSKAPAMIGRILASMQAGLILLLVGIGILWVRSSVPDGAQPLLVLGTLASALGAGFLLSAAASYAMSKRLGLLPRG